MTEKNSPSQSIEEVVLVNEKNEVLGTMPKSEVHGQQTPLHRAFSCFLFYPDGSFLLQQRASSKKTWPLVWSNSCCGHPFLNEDNLTAAKRRLAFEIGITQLDFLEEIAPYRYCFVRDGVMENEICPIIVGFTSQQPSPNADEVEAVRFIQWSDFVEDTKKNPQHWSDWCVEETEILSKHPYFLELQKKYLSLPR